MYMSFLSIALLITNISMTLLLHGRANILLFLMLDRTKNLSYISQDIQLQLALKKQNQCKGNINNTLIIILIWIILSEDIIFS